jgi:RNA polymerase sigma-70 factor (ECF subfamily)
MREVLAFHANEVADMLNSTIDSVNNALKRARASLQRRFPAAGERQPPPVPKSSAEQALVAKFVRAYQAADIDGLVGLLTADVLVSMPPILLEYEGPDAVARFFAPMFRAGRIHDLVPTPANGQPAFGTSRRAPKGPDRGRANRSRPCR